MDESRSVPGALPLFSAMHFLVDLACIFLETAFIIPVVENRVVWLGCLLVYNFVAFAGQLPVGVLGDRMKRNYRLSGIGCLLIAAAYGLFSAGRSFLPGMPTGALMPVLVSAVAGLGNACFHVGGGIEMLEGSAGKAARPGIFVSTGAFGVWLGPVLAAEETARRSGLFAGAAVMLVCGVILCRLERGADREAVSDHGQAMGTEIVVDCGRAAGLAAGASSGTLFRAAVICLMAGILFRSYAGTIMNFGWKKAGLAFLFTAGVVFGKFFGGIIGDRFGWFRTAVVSLLLSGVLFGAAEHAPAAGIAAVLCFNMTMPLTLSALADLYPGAPGAAFGMTTLALFLGTVPSVLQSAVRLGLLPAVFSRPSGVFSSLGTGTSLFLVAVVSAALLAAGLTFCRRTRAGEGTVL